MAYSGPVWVNGTEPAINDDNLNAMSRALELIAAENGGTGRSTLDAGSVLLGNGTDSIGMLLGSGALFATTSGQPQFGTLPISCGGTGATTVDGVRAALGLSNGGFEISETEPTKTNCLWIDKSDGNILKFYDTDEGAWKHVGCAFS